MSPSLFQSQKKEPNCPSFFGNFNFSSQKLFSVSVKNDRFQWWDFGHVHSMLIAFLKKFFFENKNVYGSSSAFWRFERENCHVKLHFEATKIEFSPNFQKKKLKKATFLVVLVKRGRKNCENGRSRKIIFVQENMMTTLLDPYYWHQKIFLRKIFPGKIYFILERQNFKELGIKKYFMSR